MLQVIGMGCLSERERAIEAAAPLAHTMNTLPLENPSASVTASCSGRAPQAYHTHARSAKAAARGETQHRPVAPAHQAVHQGQARAPPVLDESLHQLASQPAAL